ncbi:LOW QUALITY PROTEIN: putative polypeptide N-acetylgalactosaminyltransferase 8 [Trichechus inunguis]
MMLGRNFPKAFCIGLTVIIAFNILLVFYTKGSLQSLTVKEAMKSAMKRQENVNNTQKQAVAAKMSETKHKFHKKLFPNSQLFKQWGEGLSEAQQKKTQDLFQKFGYNVYLSNVPLNHTILDTRDSRCLQKTYSSQLPSLSVIPIFMNEALSGIQWAITSIINWTPSQVLKEIILVDDFSSVGELKAPLNEKIKFYNQKYPGILKIIRHTKRKGLAQSCNTGWEAATADVVAILDAHIEVNIGWAQPILARIQEDHTMIVSPVFDNIRFDTFYLQKYALAVDGFNWELWCRYDSLPQSWTDLHDATAPVNPSIMGILAANRLFLGEVGALDGEMLVYGGENVEPSLRIWQCGGKIKILPCSLIAHLKRHHKPYALDLSNALKCNALRVAEIWMDEYKYMVYLAWNVPLENSGIDYGDISSTKALREKLKCKSFDWYLKNVYPLLKPIHSIVGYGRMKNTLDESICLDQGPVPGNTPVMCYCHTFSPQNVYYHLTGEFYVGALIAETNTEDRCLTDLGKGESPTLQPCSKAVKNGLHIYWDFKLVSWKPIINWATKRCLEIKKDTSGTSVPVLQTCTTQVWKIQYTIRNWGQTNVQSNNGANQRELGFGTPVVASGMASMPNTAQSVPGERGKDCSGGECASITTAPWLAAAPGLGGGGSCGGGNRDLDQTEPRRGRRAVAEPSQESLLSRRETHLALWYQLQLELLEKRRGSWKELTSLEGGPLRPGAQSQASQVAKPRVFSSIQFHTREFAVPGIPVTSSTGADNWRRRDNPLQLSHLPRPSLAGTRASGLQGFRAYGPTTRSACELGGARAPPKKEGAAESWEAGAAL